MPRIFDNIDSKLVDALRSTLSTPAIPRPDEQHDLVRQGVEQIVAAEEGSSEMVYPAQNISRREILSDRENSLK